MFLILSLLLIPGSLHCQLRQRLYLRPAICQHFLLTFASLCGCQDSSLLQQPEPGDVWKRTRNKAQTQDTRNPAARCGEDICKEREERVREQEGKKAHASRQEPNRTGKGSLTHINGANGGGPAYRGCQALIRKTGFQITAPAAMSLINGSLVVRVRRCITAEKDRAVSKPGIHQVGQVHRLGHCGGTSLRSIQPAPCLNAKSFGSWECIAEHSSAESTLNKQDKVTWHLLEMELRCRACHTQKIPDPRIKDRKKAPKGSSNNNNNNLEQEQMS